MFTDPSSLVTVIASVVGAVWTLAWFMSRKFSDMTALIYRKVDEVESNVTAQLTSHEAQDNQRFSNVSDGIWDLRVRMAAKEGHITTVLPHEKA